jgi:hypothetical protein
LRALQHHVLGSNAREHASARGKRLRRRRPKQALANAQEGEVRLKTVDDRRDDRLHAEGAGDLDVERTREYLLGRAALPDDAARNDSQSIGQCERVGPIVGDEHGRHMPFAEKRSQIGAQARARREVERGERLVEKHEPWPRRHGAGQRDSLVLPA